MARTVSASDVAKYVLRQKGPIEQLKLHKLLYYCQAWSLVWDGSPIFKDRIEAWINGPVVPTIWMHHRYEHTIDDMVGDANALDRDNRETVDLVLATYGGMTPLDLVQLTHQEEPWILARSGFSAQERSATEIEHNVMRRFYTNLQQTA